MIRIGDLFTVPYGKFNKHVEPGDIVEINGNGVKRLVTCAGNHSIFYVRWKSSWCWEGRVPHARSHRNATVAHALPAKLRLVARSTPKTRALAQRFAMWMNQPVSQEDWDAVCALGCAAIKCKCKC